MEMSASKERVIHIMEHYAAASHGNLRVNHINTAQ